MMMTAMLSCGNWAAAAAAAQLGGWSSRHMSSESARSWRQSRR